MTNDELNTFLGKSDISSEEKRRAVALILSIQAYQTLSDKMPHKPSFDEIIGGAEKFNKFINSSMNK